MLTVLLEYIQDGDCFIRVYRSISLTYNLIGKDFQYTVPIMLALCLMLSGTYYAKNYAGIIGRGLMVNIRNSALNRRIHEAFNI